MIYRFLNPQTSAFIDCLNYVVNSGIDVLLGDFNIDALDEVAYRRLKDTLSGYNLKVLGTHPFRWCITRSCILTEDI